MSEPIARAVRNEESPPLATVVAVAHLTSPISAKSNDVGVCRRCRREFRRPAGYIFMYSYAFMRS
jgi:hydrogenase maturation factor HypF (carbamoyltransferase family)